MHRSFTKLIIGGTLAVVVALIVAGTASADPAKLLVGYPKGVVGAPAGWNGPSASERQHSLSVILRAYPRGVVGAPFLAAAGSARVPQQLRNSQMAVGYGSFPEVVRTMNLATVSHTATGNTSFNWGDAGIGVGIGIGALSVLALCSVGLRRYRSTPATA